MQYHWQKQQGKNMKSDSILLSYKHILVVIAQGKAL